MKPIDTLVSLIANDARNIKDVFRESRSLDLDVRNRLIAMCALRLLQAEALDDKVGAKNEVRMARANLVFALEANGETINL